MHLLGFELAICTADSTERPVPTRIQGRGTADSIGLNLEKFRFQFKRFQFDSFRPNPRKTEFTLFKEDTNTGEEHVISLVRSTNHVFTLWPRNGP